MSTSQHTTQSGEPDMRFKENQEGEPYQKEAGQKGGSVSQGQGGQGSQGSQGGSKSGGQGGSQGQSNLGGEHLTKEGQPDMRFKENQEGEPYQVEAGQKGGSVTQGESQGGSNIQSGRGQSQSEHLTKEGEPDMRFKENKESIGQS